MLESCAGQLAGRSVRRRPYCWQQKPLGQHTKCPGQSALVLQILTDAVGDKTAPMPTAQNTSAAAKIPIRMALCFISVSPFWGRRAILRVGRDSVNTLPACHPRSRPTTLNRAHPVIRRLHSSASRGCICQHSTRTSGRRNAAAASLGDIEAITSSMASMARVCGEFESCVEGGLRRDIGRRAYRECSTAGQFQSVAFFANPMRARLCC
jgi:hypothetical protein